MSFLARLVRTGSASLIARKAASDEAFENGKQLAFHGRETVEIYFNKYGTAAKKFEYHPQGNFYIGYVKNLERGEFLSVIFMSEAGCVASSFEPPMQFGQDVLGLMGKKEFADQVALSFIQAAR